ncbi:MAG: selenocysteine-specific translation elongation factor [Synergistes sp.]|nr:selenocysteine-specific translation elongation factor [Synergistes sp.]
MHDEYPFVIGTSGHIDHGKTALVRALTGVDCDRLAEEKERGMTIELGFAPLELPSGITVSIIDVPGHEKFIRQMVAGAAGIDAVMLVVAADDGVMPQTREHIAILSLLGIKNGLTVINKTDLVDEEMLELATDDVKNILHGTFLEDKPVIPVSALTGAGIAELKNELQKMTEKAKPRDRKGPFFMPVDRAFHVSGFGTTVTGTAIKGEVHEGDEVEILPQKVLSKVRSLQVHGESVGQASAGQRVAANLAGIPLDGIKRGDVIAAKGRFTSSNCINVSVKVLPDAKPIKHWQRMRLHVGTSDSVARLSLIDRTVLKPGDSANAQLITETPVATHIGANFILRNYSPLVTTAGGVVLSAAGERPKNKHAQKALSEYLKRLENDASLKERIAALADYKGEITVQDAAEVNEATPLELMRAASPSEARGEIFIVRDGSAVILSRSRYSFLEQKLSGVLSSFHAEHPERMGLSAEECARALGISDVKFARGLLQLFDKQGAILYKDERVRLAGFEPFNEDEIAAAAEAIKKLALKAGASMPTIEEAKNAAGITDETMQCVISSLREKKEIALISGTFICLKEVEMDFRKKLEEISGDLTLAALRDATGCSRKYMLPMLEYLDGIGVTRRVGDKRIITKR